MNVMCPVDLERQLVLNSDFYGMYPKIKSANRESVEHMRQQSAAMDIDEMAHLADEPRNRTGRVHAEVYAKGKLGSQCRAKRCGRP